MFVSWTLSANFDHGSIMRQVPYATAAKVGHVRELSWAPGAGCLVVPADASGHDVVGAALSTCRAQVSACVSLLHLSRDS